MKKDIINSKIVIKLGTKVIFDTEHKEIQKNVIRGVARDIFELLKKGNEIIIVSSGAVGCGKNIIKGENNIGIKQARAAVGQIKLMKEYSDIFGEFNLDIAQFLLNKNDLNSEKLKNIKIAYKNLGRDIIPIINENDVTTTDELTFGDNDYLSAEILKKFNFDILLTLTDLGALIKDGKIVLKSNKFNVDDYDDLSADDGFGFGGLKSKLDVAKEVVGNGKKFVIGKAGDSIINILKLKDDATWFMTG